MKKYFIFPAFIFVMQFSFGQTCVTTFSTVNLIVGCQSYPYSYGNNSYQYPGTYTVNLVNSKGCDSVVTLNLNLPPAGTSTTNVTICATQLPYTWGLEPDIFTAGTYYNYINIYGCSPDIHDDSVAILHLTVLPADTVVFNQTICVNQLPYNWFGQVIYTDGTYTAVVPNSGHGKCGTIGLLNATISDAATSNTNLTICSAQLPYTWNGQVLTQGGSYSASIVTPDPNDCDSVANLYLTVTDNKTSEKDTSICANQLPYVWNGQSYSATGTYTKNFSTGTLCDSIVTLKLVIKPLPTITSFTPATGGQGQAVVITGTNFTGTTNVSFGGSPASSFSIQSPTSIIATVGAATTGAISVTTPCSTVSLGGFTYGGASGNIGIGVGTATSKLTVSGGDLQVADIGSGIILKSPDGSCWRVTIDNFGNLIRTKIPCP